MTTSGYSKTCVTERQSLDRGIIPATLASALEESKKDGQDVAY
jgi:hypothetical protein